jgi:NAD(P)-dependent dehydrogenase (short-subunit alcohol dehydrogenase family)
LENLDSISTEVGKVAKKSPEVPVDVTSEEPVRDMVKNILADFSRIDILVNEFSTRIRQLAVDFPVDEWQRVIKVKNQPLQFLSCRL